MPKRKCSEVGSEVGSTAGVLITLGGLTAGASLVSSDLLSYTLILAGVKIMYEYNQCIPIFERPKKIGAAIGNIVGKRIDANRIAIEAENTLKLQHAFQRYCRPSNKSATLPT